MKFLLLLLAALSCRCYAQVAQITETELWRFYFDISTTDEQRSNTVAAANVWGLLVDRPLVSGLKPNLSVYSSPDLGWAIASTNISGPVDHPVAAPEIVITRAGVIRMNPEWNGGTFGTTVMVHELAHTLGFGYFGSYYANGISTETEWFGVYGVAAYQAEFMPFALAVPMEDAWHVSESALPLDIMSPVISWPSNGFDGWEQPEVITLTTMGCLRDLGCIPNPMYVTAMRVKDLIGKRRFPKPIVIPTP